MPDIETLKSALVTNNVFAERCTIAVFAGLLTEYIILFWTQRKDFSKLEFGLAVAAAILIAGGVYGEYFFGSRASDAALGIEKISEDRIASLNKEAGEARERAAILENESFLLKQQLLFQGPRAKLVEANAGPFVKAMRPFAGQKIELRLNPSGIKDPKDVEEMEGLVTSIRFLLGQVSGWSISDTQGENGWGITIVVNRKSSSGTRNAAAALVSALGDFGLTDMNRRRPGLIVAQAGSVNDRENTPPETILLYIGRHP
jgi:hypothetical protein